MRRATRLSLLTLPWLVFSCTAEHTNSHPTKIIGENDLLPVGAEAEHLPEGLRPFTAAIGLLDVGCTVTHIGEGLVLTAGHCIPRDNVNPDECLSKNFAGMTIRWDFRSVDSPIKMSKCLKRLAAELSPSHDFAILSVDNAPAVSLPVALGKRVPAGGAITLLGHPHKRPMEWSKTCTVVDFPVDFMPDLNADQRAHLFAHQCDTEQGNSGSPLIDLQLMRVIGIHHGGLNPWNTATWVPGSTVESTLVRLRGR